MSGRLQYGGAPEPVCVSYFAFCPSRSWRAAATHISDYCSPAGAITTRNSLPTFLPGSVTLSPLKRGYLHRSLARFNGKISN